MKKEEKGEKQNIDFIKKVKPESKINKFLNTCKKHKAITISSSIGIILIILIIAVIIIYLPRETEEVSNENNIAENTTIEEANNEEQDILLQTDTNGLADGTEVAIIKNDDGTVEVIAKNDPKFAEKTAGKNYSTGTIGNGGVNLKTSDNDLISIASKPQEEQKNNVKVENNTTPDTTVDEQQPETPAQPTDNNQGSTSSGSTSKPSGGSSSSTKPSGNTGSGSSGSSSSKPSGGSSSSSSGGSSSSSGSGSSDSSSSNKGQYPPLTIYKEVHRTDKENQAIAWIKEELESNGFSQYATVVHASSRPSNMHYSTFSERNAKAPVTGGAVGTVYVYVEDLYMSTSNGNPTSTPFDVAMYIWIV